jgi:signal transduction histidine kinase/ActR/RegA family two-component response regulator
MSIRARLLLITLLATLAPAVLLFLHNLDQRRNEVRGHTARLSAIAEQTAETLAGRIQGTAQLHYGLSRASDLASGDRAACSGFLAEVREAYPQYTGILTVQPDGRLFCDSLRSGRELDLNDREYFRRALQTRGEVVLEPAFGRLTGVAVMQVAYPVRKATGELMYVLLASLDLQGLLDLEPLDVPGARVVLVSHKGVVLATKPSGSEGGLKVGTSIVESALFKFAATQVGAATADLEGPGGEIYRWAVANTTPTEHAGVYVLAGAPRSALLAEAERSSAKDLLAIAGMSVALFLAVWLLAEVAVRKQLSRVTAMARRLAQGELSARIDPPLPKGELGDLMGMLNDTARSLEQQRDDIAKLNAQLLQSQRLEAVGQLTGGVAHDFNNLLTVVLGNAELLAEQSVDKPQQRMLAEMIASAAQRGAELTQRLLAFARKQALAPSVTDINHLVANFDPMLRRTLGEHIEIELIRGAGLWNAMVDAGQLESALLNLCLNARDAMLSGGRLTIETANMSLDQAYADRFPDVTAGQYVMLAVSDTGNGIAPEHLAKVFEPFFTTKPKGKGTGLGLAMVYGFVKQTGGHVNVYSEPGQGTTVKLYLPRAVGDARAPEPAPERGIVGGHESILVVEDDELVRRYAVNELHALGYHVLAADSGKAALALLERHPNVDLLFTDVVMPGGMSGRDLADAARQRWPQLKVLYTSGYTENAIVHHGRLDPGVVLLAKPYRRAELARAIRVALAASAAD